MSCVFCEIANKDEKKQILYKYKKDDIRGICDIIVFEPLNPFTQGHLLFVPDIHIDNFSDNKFYASDVIQSTYSAIYKHLQLYPQQCNIINNNGIDAQQTIFHLHVHLIPRLKEDGIDL